MAAKLIDLKLDRAQSIWSLSAVVAAFIWLQAKVVGVYPTVFQDEWIYSMHSRLLPLSDSPIANYLYSWVYSSTNVCGLDFYSCNKQINVIFMLVFGVGVFLVARKFLAFSASLAIAFLSVISPISTYASFYMPESMYFAFSIFAVWALLDLRDRPVFWRYAVAGAILGATALVKPHSLFLLPVAGLFILFVAKPEGFNFVKRLLNAVVYLGGFLVFKFGFGLLAAGSAGLVWFGTSYEATLKSVLTPAALGSSLHTPTHALAAGEQLQALADSGTGNVVQLFFAQLGGHYLGLFAITGVVLAPVIILLTDKISTKLRDLSWFVVLSAVIFVPAFALFAAMAIVGGDPLQDRLVMRYYEFLIPLTFIAGIAGWDHMKESRLQVRNVAIAVSAVGLFIVGITGVGAYLPLIWDGAVLQGLASQRWLLAIASFVSAFILLANFGRKNVLVKTLLVVVLPISVVASGLVATDTLRANALTPVAFDLAGQYARDNLSVDDKQHLVVVGQVRNELEAAKFWIDTPQTGQFVATANSTVDLATLPAGTKWVITMNGIQVSGPATIVQGGDGWNIYKVNG
jgi:phosphoglycerol transferase